MAKKPLKLGVVTEILDESYTARAERRIPPSLCESLLESIRKSLPEDQKPPELVVLVTKFSPLYSTFLGKITSGSSVRSAAIAIGISPTKMANWVQQGAGDALDELDTFCARLLQDVQRAACIAVSDAEERVFEENPDKWLARSPTGKQFNKGQYWNEQAKLSGPENAPEDENLIEPIPMQAQIEGPEDRTEEESIEDDLDASFKVLENLGIVQDPEFVKQAKDQFRSGGDGG